MVMPSGLSPKATWVPRPGATPHLAMSTPGITSTVDRMLINAYATHIDPPLLTFPHELNARRDWRDPALADHLQGLRGFLYQRITQAHGPGAQLTAEQRALDDHVQRVRNHLSFHVDASHMEAVSKWAMAANAVLFFEDTTMRDPLGRVLSGDAIDGDATVPHLTQGRVRKQASIARLRARGVATLDWLPAMAPDPEVVLRSPVEIVDRISSLTAVAARAEALHADNELAVDSLRKRLPHAFVALSPMERTFLDQADPHEQSVVNFVWRYECVSVLLWVLDRYPTLPYPTATCDVSLVTRTVLNTSYDDLVRGGTVRTVAEVLDHADLLYRLHWAVVNARENDGVPPAGVQGSIVVERRHTFEWLIDTETAWDDIALST